MDKMLKSICNFTAVFTSRHVSRTHNFHKEKNVLRIFIKHSHTNIAKNTHHAHGLVLAIAIPVKNLNLQRTIHVTVTQRRHGNLDRGPDGIQGIVDLGTLPHHRVRVVLVQSMTR